MRGALEAGAAGRLRGRQTAGLDRRQLRPELLRVGGGAELPTLLVLTETHLGLEEAHVEALQQWAVSLH